MSSNWVSESILKGSVSRVLWVSGRDLLLPNRNARIAWLRRKLLALPPQDAKTVEAAIELTDWQELETRQIRAPLAVTVDFDSFCHDPGDPAERFVDEISTWTARVKPGLVTLALSAAYQSNAAASWTYLDRFIATYSRLSPKDSWYLEAGPYGAVIEGEEERTAWRTWKERSDTFGHREGPFLPGAAIWLAPPSFLRERLLSLSIRPGDEAAQDMITGWGDRSATELERSFPPSITDEILAISVASIESSWGGGKVDPPGKGERSFGLALRILANGGDRGCFAMYKGLSDTLSSAAYCAALAVKDPRYQEITESERELLDIEVSIFGDWTGMDDPEDFLPGRDSLMLTDGADTTLLQASVAAERGYDRIAFLERLSNKAGLGIDGWKRQGLRFNKASTVWARKRLTSIEDSEAYQKYEKK